MSTTAIITMSIAWIIIGFFMLRFLIKVIRTPMNTKGDGTDEQ